MLKKLFSLLLCICLVSSICLSSATVKAAIVNKGVITIESVSGMTGDTVIVPIRMDENPGMMAMTISITYNAQALEYERYYMGDVISDYYIVNHPTKNLLRFVNCENKDKNKNGTILSLQFKIKDNAEADFHKIDIAYSTGDFCNWNLDKIMPEVISGGVEVAFNGNNCKHKKYGDWKLIVEAGCEENGVEQRSCKKCEHVENRDIAAIGHEYPDHWTIDEVATPKKDGTMSRHCIRCDNRVDIMTFTYEHTTEDDVIENEPEAEVPKNDFTEDIFKEQYPDQELTPNKPQDSVSSNQNGSSSDTTSSKPNSSSNSSTASKNESATASDLVASAIESKPTSGNSSATSSNASSDTSTSSQDTSTNLVGTNSNDSQSNSTTSSSNTESSSNSENSDFSSDSSSKTEIGNTTSDKDQDKNDSTLTDSSNTANTDAKAVFDKISEVFPQSEQILNYFEIAVMILLFLLF